MNTTGLLLTRASVQAAATAVRLETSGYRVWQAPLLTMLPLPWEPPRQPLQAVLLTSANACPALADGRLSRDLPVFVVGDATATAARDAGFTRIESAHENAGALAGLLERSCRPDLGALLYLRGETVTGQLAEILTGAGFQIEQRMVYRAQPATSLPPDVRLALQQGRVAGVLLYSARTADIFSRLMNGQPGREKMSLFCLSAAVAHAAGPGWKRVIVAHEPNETSLLLTLPAAGDLL